MVEGRNLAVMDPTGKSDPYCVVSIGKQEAKRTSVQYSTVCPTWHETLQFDVTGVPQLMQNEQGVGKFYNSEFNKSCTKFSSS